MARRLSRRAGRCRVMGASRRGRRGGAGAVAADVAVQIDEAIQQRLKVDWWADPDVQNEMRNAIDDLLYEAKAKQGGPLSAPDMDAIIEPALDIAKNRYAK